MIRAALPALFLLLAACGAPMPRAPGPAAPPVPPAAEDTCGAAAQAGLVGRNATALERVLLMRQVRLLRPGQPATADLRPQRITFEIGPDERITRIFCG